MYANSLISALILVAAGSSFAQDQLKPGQLPGNAVPTIGQLAEQARAKRIAEANAKAAQPASGSPTSGSQPSGMVIVPSTQIMTGAGGSSGKPEDSAKKTEKPAKQEPPPEFIPAILGIYRHGNARTVELVEVHGNARFSAGQITPSGWQVLSIGSQRVELGKSDPKNGGQRKITLQLVVN